MDFSRIKGILFAAIGIYIAFSMVRACTGSSRNETVEVEIPTQGLITTVVEVEPQSFKIEDETTIADTAASLIIAKYQDGKIDTFTLAEARLTQSGNSSSTGRHHMGSGIMMAAGAGMMGYMMGRSMSTPPSPTAYTNQQTYSRVNQTTGTSFRNSTARVSRPSMGRSGGTSAGSGRSSSGFGGGRSSRGFGG